MHISMTGFGRAAHKSPLGLLSVEIQSLNRKFLDVSISLPKELSRFEVEIRKWAGETIGRGQVVVRVALSPEEGTLSLPPKKLMKSYKKALQDLAQSLDFDEKEITLSFLLKTAPPYGVQFDESELLAVLEKCVKEALKKLVMMKRREGRVLEKEIHKHLKLLQDLIDSIDKQAPVARNAAQKRLKEMLQDVLQEDGPLDERLVHAAISFSDRSDITEELARLRSHCVQFKTIKEGRTLDFLVQEMGREINTIGAKSADLKISHAVVSAKSELEKIKEQLQNIE